MSFQHAPLSLSHQARHQSHHTTACQPTSTWLRPQSPRKSSNLTPTPRLKPQRYPRCRRAHLRRSFITREDLDDAEYIWSQVGRRIDADTFEVLCRRCSKSIAADRHCDHPDFKACELCRRKYKSASEPVINRYQGRANRLVTLRNRVYRLHNLLAEDTTDGEGLTRYWPVPPTPSIVSWEQELNASCKEETWCSHSPSAITQDFQALAFNKGRLASGTQST